MAVIAAREFAPGLYEGIGYDELTNYAIYSLIRKGMETTFENIVAEAFTLFPRRFSLRGYPEWPDSAVVNKSWLRCRTDKHYIEGSVKEGFRLTPKGLKVAEEMEARLVGRKVENANKEIKAELRTRAGRLLSALENAKAYIRYRDTGELADVKDHELKDMLLLMPDSDAKAIKHNIELFKQAADLYQRRDVLELLAKVERRLLAEEQARRR